MLVAGGLIALLLVGVLIDGALTADDGPPENETAANSGDDASDPDGEGGTIIEGGLLAEVLFGTSGSDDIHAKDGDDTVSGGDGDDILRGQTGDDHLDGEDGDDTLDGGPGADALTLRGGDLGIGGDGPDLFQVTDMASNEDGDVIACVADFQPGYDQLVLDFDGTEAECPDITFDAESTPGSTLILADGTPVTLLEGVSGVSEADVVVRMSESAVEGDDPTDDPNDGEPDAYTGADLMDGGTPDDVLRARLGMDGQFGQGGHDALTGSHEGDTIDGGTGNDAVFGNEGGDHLSGQDGADELYGDEGDDTLIGGGGTDFLVGGEGHDQIDGGTRSDLLFGGAGDDSLSGGDGNDFLQGGMGADHLAGGAGNDRLDGTFAKGDADFGPYDEDAGDTLDGGSGDDTIAVGAGDIATGGAGADTFRTGSYVETAELAGTVTDFDPSVDRIEVLYDPNLTPNPEVSVVDHSDGSGADIVLNGQVILSVTGARGLEVGRIDMQAITLDQQPEPA